MAFLPIRKLGDPVLRKRARPVARLTKRHQRLIRDMIETMHRADGIGLAANQVGVLDRIFVADVGDGPLVFVNPELRRTEGREVDVEGCLSIPGVTGYVERAARVVVSAQDADGRTRTVEAAGLLARVIQHELDHLDGILFIDKATSITPQVGETGSGEGARG